MDSYEYQFTNLSENSLHWHNKAGDLFASAMVLWTAMEDGSSAISCWSTYKMLMGLSFELLFKAIAIEKNLGLSTHHKLVELANKAGLKLTNDEKAVLTVLTQYIIWDGKYPVPHKKSQLENHWKYQNKVTNDEVKVGTLTLQVGNDSLDLDALTKTWRKYSDIYMKEYKKSHPT